MTGAASAAPRVADLVHRLAACPADFLAPPLIGTTGTVAVAAVLGDTLEALGSVLPEAWAARLAPSKADASTENWLRACLVVSWLAADEALVRPVTGPQLLDFLDGDLRRVAELVRADRLVEDPDRREELGRFLLRAAGAVPAAHRNRPRTAWRRSTPSPGSGWRPRPRPPRSGPGTCGPPGSAGGPHRRRPGPRGSSDGACPPARRTPPLAHRDRPAGAHRFPGGARCARVGPPVR